MILAPNPGHPLNRKRLTWHLAMPGRDAGSRSVDLMGRVGGTLVGFDATTGWQGAQRPGSFARAVKIKDSSSYLDIGGVSASLTGLANASMAWWLYRTAGTQAEIGQGVSPNRFLMQWYSDDNVYCCAEDGVGGSFPFGNPGLTGWVRLLQTFDGAATGMARTKLYANGLAVTLSSLGSDPPTALVAPSSKDFRVGDHASTAGTFDDVTVWARTLSPADAWMDYSLSRAGYPGVLARPLWIGRLAAAAAVGGGGASWQYFLDVEG